MGLPHMPISWGGFGGQWGGIYGSPMGRVWVCDSFPWSEMLQPSLGRDGTAGTACGRARSVPLRGRVYHCPATMR